MSKGRKGFNCCAKYGSYFIELRPGGLSSWCLFELSQVGCIREPQEKEKEKKEVMDEEEVDKEKADKVEAIRKR